MEHIQKQISLETAKDRLVCSGITHMSDTLYAYDRIVASGDTGVTQYETLIPLIKLKDGNYLLRYKNLVNKYYWLKNQFIKSCSIYTKCKRNDDITYIKHDDNNPFNNSGITEDNIGYSVGIASSLTVGSIFCISSKYDELMKKYEKYLTAKTFYNWICGVLSGGTYDDIGITASTPYINCDFYIEEKYDDEGILTPYVTEWEAGKKVSVGDVVYYNSGTTQMETLPYKLMTGNTYSDYKSDSLGNIEISKQIFDSYVETGYTLSSTTHSFVYSATTNDGITTYYLYTPHYEGEFNRTTKLFSFDSTSSTHYSQSYTQGSTASTFSYISQSHLGDVKPKKISCDDSGNTLPFNYTISGDKLIPLLQYKCCLTNTEKSVDGRNLANAMESIKYYNTSDSSKCKIRTLKGNYEIDIELPDVVYDAIEFDYYILSEIVSGYTYQGVKSAFVDTNTGIHFNEKYLINHVIGDFTIEGTNWTGITYIQFERQLNEGEINSDLEKIGLQPTFAAITSHTADSIFEKIPIFKEESLIGIVNQTKDIDVELDRGRNEAFEKHNALSEINTMQDLLHYRNDYWKVASES